MASVTRRGDSFLAQVRLKRSGVIVFSESRTFPTEALARSWAERLEKEARLRGPGRAATRGLTVGDLVLKHLAYQQSFRELGRSTIHNHETTAAAFDRIRLHDLRAHHITDFVRRRAAEGAAPATILANLSPLRAAVQAARHAHGIEADGAEVELAVQKLLEAGALGRSKEVVRVMSDDEEAALVAELARHDAHHQSRIRMVFSLRLAVALPRRAAELCRLQWDDVDLRRRTIVIRDVKHPRRKKGNDQTVPLVGPAFELIEQAPRLEARVLPWSEGSMTAAFERARERIATTGMPGIRDLRFHDLRHTGITRLLALGLTASEVMLISGHTSERALRRYAHLKPEDVHRRFERLTTTAS